MTVYTTVFGNETVPPAELSYRAVSLTANTTLYFPEVASTVDILAGIMDVTASAGPFVFTLPAGNTGSSGYAALFRNVGANSFTVNDAAANLVATVGAGEAKFLYLTDNTTVSGSWKVFTYGTGTSGADASALAGQGLSSLANQLVVNSAVNTTASTANLSALSDRGEVYVFTGGSVTCNLPTVATAGNGWFVDVANNGTGTVTVDNTDGTLIDGATNKLLTPSESCRFYTDGLAWYSIGYGRSAQFVFTKLVKDITAGSPFTLTASECSNKLLQFIGTAAANITVNVPPVVAIYYVQCAFSGAFTLTLKTTAGTGVALSNVARSILYCDGTDVVDAQTVAASTILAMVDGSAAIPALYFAADTDTGVYRAGSNSFGIAAGGAQSATFTTTGMNDTPVGVTTPRAGAFTTLSATGALTLATPLPVSSGGTGIASYTIGDIIYASGTTAFTKLTAVATGNALISGGVGTAPSWGKIALTTHVSGILPVANGGTNNAFFGVSGPTTSVKTYTFPDATCTILTSNAAVTVGQGGTGATTLTANNLLLGNGTSAVAFVAPSTSGNYLKSNGTTWQSTAPGAYTANGFTMTTARLLGRTTASTGAAEEITVGTGLTLSSGTLTATGSTSFSSVNTTTGGTAIEFTSVISTTANEVNFFLNGVSGSGTSILLVQIGDSGGYENTGYLAAGGLGGSEVAQTAGFPLGRGSANGNVLYGFVTLKKQTGTTWHCSYNLYQSNGAQIYYGAGLKTLSGDLDSIRLTAVNGTDTIDANAGISVSWSA